MEKISIKDLINRYRNLEFYDIQDRVALVGLAILIVLGVYKGYSKDIKIRNLESNLKSVSDIIDSQDESLYTYADDTYNMHMRDELDYLRSREETYYKASNLKLIRYREDSPWRIAVPSVRVTISDLSVHDDVFKDTPCTKVIDG